MSTNWTDQSVRAYFWKTAEAEALEVPQCMACRKFFFYPRAVCPECWSEDIEFKPVSGRGIVWSYTVVHFAHGNAGKLGIEVPYAVVLVALEEGVRMMGTLIDSPMDAIKIGMPVRMTYREIGGRRMPVYRPA